MGMRGDAEQAAEWAAEGSPSDSSRSCICSRLCSDTTSVAGTGATDESTGLKLERATLSLRLDLAGKRLRDNLAVSHDMRVGRYFVHVVGCFGGPQRVQEVAVDRLKAESERGAGLFEFLDQRAEEFPNRVVALQRSIGRKEDRLCGVVRDDAFEISLEEALDVPPQNFLSR